MRRCPLSFFRKMDAKVQGFGTKSDLGFPARHRASGRIVINFLPGIIFKKGNNTINPFTGSVIRRYGVLIFKPKGG